jgi:hypothetical protein
LDEEKAITILDVVECAEQTVMGIIMKERERYIDYYRVIEQFCKDNDVLIGGETLKEMAMKNNCFKFDLYTAKLSKHSKKLIQDRRCVNCYIG